MTAQQEDMAFEQPETEFNAAIATLIRIDAIKKHLINASHFNNPLDKFKLLKEFYSELRPIIQPKEREDQDDNLNICEKAYNAIKVELKKNQTYPFKYSKTLDSWENELRILDQQYGLNMPKKSDARWAMSRR